MLANFMHRADMGMIERRGGPSLALESFDGLGVGDEFIGQEFQGHGTP